MKAILSHWASALAAALRARMGTTNAAPLPGLADPRRLKFDREFDALIEEMGRQLPAAR